MSFVQVRGHYERHPYPHYPLLASVRRHDTYAMNLQALWARFNGERLEGKGRILLSGCGAFAPYPMSLSNPDCEITAVDLAEANIRRARLHCLLHGRFNVRYLLGDFLRPEVTPGPFHFIEAFGVLHHLDDPAEGMLALEKRLAPGGILRVMVYGRYARQEAESVRRAMRLLKIRDVPTLKKLLVRAPAGSRIREYLDASWESRTDTGLADLFLHPNVHTYRIDEFLAEVAKTRLKPLLFTHSDALSDPAAEIERLRDLDRRRETRTNIICYLGLDCKGESRPEGNARLMLNPALAGSLSPLALKEDRVIARLGHENPLLDRSARRFLRRFRTPVPVAELSDAERREAAAYLRSLFLVSIRG